MCCRPFKHITEKGYDDKVISLKDLAVGFYLS